MSHAERILKASIVQPLTDIDSINSRLDALEEILSSQAMYDSLRQAMATLPRNIGSQLSKFGLKRLKGQRQMQRRLSALLDLKKGLSSLPLIYDALEGDENHECSSSLLKNIQHMCQHHMLKDIHATLSSQLEDESMMSSGGRSAFPQLMQQVCIQSWFERHPEDANRSCLCMTCRRFSQSDQERTRRSIFHARPSQNAARQYMSCAKNTSPSMA